MDARPLATDVPADRVPLVEVRMVRRDLTGLPRFALPAPYSLRMYRPGDDATWVRIHGEAERYHDVTPELFQREFLTGPGDEAALGERQFYLCDGAGREIGTGTAWWHPAYGGLPHGRIHWVAIVPGAQGLGLGRPLISALCQRFVQLRHERAYLTTETVRRPAIHLYRQFGFVPDIAGEADERAWREIETGP